MKKILALILCLCMVPFMAACGGGGDQGSSDGDQVTLKLWCIATESDANRPAYLQAIEDYEAANPGVKIEMEAFENESYKTKIKAAMTGGSSDDLPDIFFTWGGAFLGDFVDAGKVVCLDDVYANNYTEDQIPSVMLNNSSYGGKHYGVPTTFNIVAMYANMDLLAQAGWDKVPETYDELIQCCDDLVAAGIIPFGCAGSVDPSGVALGTDEVKANFLAGKTAFYQNGSWNTGEVAGADFKSAVAMFPVINADRSTANCAIGGPSDHLAVCSESANADLAAEVAVALGKEICHYNYLNAVGLPAWTPDYDTSSLEPLMVDIGNIVNQCEGMVLFGDTAMSADPAQIYLDYVAKVYGKEIDGQGFIDGLTKDLQ